MRRYDTIHTSDALMILLSNLESYSGIELDEIDSIVQIAENDFHFTSKSRDYRDVFDFCVAVFIDPVICRIVYKFHDSIFGDNCDIEYTSVEYNHVECDTFEYPFPVEWRA